MQSPDYFWIYQLCKTFSKLVGDLQLSVYFPLNNNENSTFIKMHNCVIIPVLDFVMIHWIQEDGENNVRT